LKKLIISSIFGLSTSLFANAVCNTDSNDLLKQLVQNHPTIKMSQEAIKAAKERVDSAFWGFFPTPSVDVSSRDSDRYTTTARLDQPIWTGGKLMSKYDMANSKEQEDFFALQENSYSLIEKFLSVLESYMQSKSHMVQLQAGLDKHYELLEMLERRMDAGVSSSSDESLLQSRIEQIKSDMALQENRYKVSVMQLELMLDTKLDCSVELDPIHVLHSKHIEDTIDRMLASHPSLQKADHEIQTARYELDGTKASIMPNLSLRAEHTRGDLYDENYNRDSQNQSIVYVAFTASTNAGLSAVSDISAARIRVNELSFKKESLKKELIDGVLQDYNNYENTKTRIKIVENSVKASQEVLDSYTRLFIAGKRQWLNLVDASRELMQYHIQLSNLEVTKNILMYKLALKNGQVDLLNGEIR